MSSKRDLQTRREFIETAGALGVGALGCGTSSTVVDAGAADMGAGGRPDALADPDSGAAGDAEPRDAEPHDAAQMDGGQLDSGAPDAGPEQCDPTIAQAEGPFGQDGLQRSNLNLYGHRGVAFELRGRVVDAACQPVAGAQVLLWHATPSPPGVQPQTLTQDPEYEAAVYDHELEGGKMTPDGQTIPTGERQYYGWVETDAEGAYAFQSLRPGWYLNGARYRASHLHVKVLVNGQARITSQIYFPDDPFNDDDQIFLACANVGNCTMVLEAPGQGRYDLAIA